MSTPLDSNESLNSQYQPLLTGGPDFATTTISSATGKEQRNVNRWDPLWIWRVRYNQLKKSELQSLQTFFSDRRGRYQSFLFKRPFQLTEVRARFNQDRFEATIDFGSTSSVELEVLEVLPALSPETATSFPPSAGTSLPDNFSAAVTGGPTFGTSVISYAPGVEKRVETRPEVRRWTIDYNALSYSQLLDLVNFFVARNGKAQTFQFLPPGETLLSVPVRFDSDRFDAHFDINETGATGSIDLVEVL